MTESETNGVTLANLSPTELDANAVRKMLEETSYKLKQNKARARAAATANRTYSERSVEFQKEEIALSHLLLFRTLEEEGLGACCEDLGYSRQREALGKDATLFLALQSYGVKRLSDLTLSIAGSFSHDMDLRGAEYHYLCDLPHQRASANASVRGYSLYFKGLKVAPATNWRSRLVDQQEKIQASLVRDMANVSSKVYEVFSVPFVPQQRY